MQPLHESGEPETSPVTPAVRLDTISKRLGWTWALREIRLRVDRGSSVAVIGPNGAGKTTLLRLLATLLKPTSGTGAVLGIPLQDGAEAIRARVGLLASRGHLYDDLTALENLRFAVWMAGSLPDPKRLQAALEEVGLGQVTDRIVREFSSGMRKRLAFAVLLLRPLDLVLLDEPYSSLDADGVQMVDGFVDEWRQRGSTVLLATHRRGAAVHGADRVAILDAGRLRRYCPPTELEPSDLKPFGEMAKP